MRSYQNDTGAAGRGEQVQRPSQPRNHSADFEAIPAERSSEEEGKEVQPSGAYEFKAYPKSLGSEVKGASYFTTVGYFREESKTPGSYQLSTEDGVFPVGESTAVFPQSGEGVEPAKSSKLFAWQSWQRGGQERERRHRSSELGLKRPLRVVHVGPCLTRAGAEIWLVDLVRFLDPSLFQFEKAVVVNDRYVDPGFRAGLPLDVEVGGKEAVREAAKRADILISWGVCLDGLLDGVRPHLSVFIAHGTDDYTRNLVELNARHVDQVIAVSSRVRDMTCDGVPATVILNGVDTQRLARTRSREEVRASLGFGPSDIVVGTLGRFAPEKRVHLIIEALGTLPAKFKGLLVGWGPLLPELLEQANRELPGRYAFLTAADYLGDYYQAMDVFCQLGTWEGCSLAILEAMHCGLPVVATPVGAVPELILDRVNGIVVAPAAEAVRRALERIESYPHWAQGIAREGKRTADRVGHAGRMASEYEQLLLRLWTAKYGSWDPAL